jgi:hypothetical protein
MKSLKQKHEWRSLVNYLFVATSYSILVYAKLVDIVMIQLLGLMEDNRVQQPEFHEGFMVWVSGAYIYMYVCMCMYACHVELTCEDLHPETRSLVWYHLTSRSSCHMGSNMNYGMGKQLPSMPIITRAAHPA